MLREPFDLVTGGLPTQHTRLGHGQGIDVVRDDDPLRFRRIVVSGFVGSRFARMGGPC
ncbi:hypothetical protein ACFROD_43500 [Streptomyces mirabilis]|uniref:hypothetical protein n=1 Tax=Streptomyces mirabilis TaxID=68239 RepID=UPI003674B749